MNNQKKRIYLSSPHMGGGEQRFVDEAFSTNWIAPLGPNVDAFEKELASYCEVKGALALSSGTVAIHLALKLLNVGPGDIVFCSSLTFVASVNPVLYQGAKPVFIDSEPDTWNMSPQALSIAFKDAEESGLLPKAVIIVNLYGQSADMDPLINICNQYHVSVIEDAAESLGATYKGKKSGSIGKLGIYSFNGNKIITTSGGGMLVSDNLDLLEKARFWATQSRDYARHYQHSDIGFNYRLSNVLAGIGRGQLQILDDRIKTKKHIYDTYFQELGNINGITFMPEAEFGQSTHWLTAVKLDTQQLGVTPNQLMDALERQNIESRPVWKPMHLQPLFKDSPYYSHQENESISDELFEQGVCLPSGSNLSEDELNFVLDTITTTLKNPIV